MARLSDDLRRLPDDALARLFAARSDLRADPPEDMAALAQKVATPHGARLGLEALDLPTLQVCHHVLLVAAHPLGDGLARLDDLAEWIPLAPGGPEGAELLRELADAVQRLREVGLAHGDPARPVSGLRHVLAAPAAAGRTTLRLLQLAPADAVRLVAAHHGLDDLPDDAAVDAARGRLAELLTRLGPAVLDGAPPASVELLLDLVESREYVVRLPTGPVERWGPPGRDPVLELVRRGAVVPVTAEVGEVPRELRHAALLEPEGYLVRFTPPPAPPAPDAAARRQAAADAADRARRVVGLVERLLEEWSREPGAQLASGGLGVKELRRAGKLLEVDEREAGRVVELALVAGLLATERKAATVLPSAAYDDWRELDTAERWAALAEAWWATDRLPSAAGSRDDGPPVPALHWQVPQGAREARRGLLRLLADTPGLSEDDVAERIHWGAPARWAADGSDLELPARGAYAEALLLGLVSGAPVPGVVAPWGPDGTGDWPSEAAVERLVDALPAPVEQVTLQADLTAVASGPVAADAARVLDLLADVESRGAATVWRFGPASVRRAFDDGWTPAQVLAELGALAARGVPGTLEALVADVARRHGQVRVGAAAAYVLCADEAVLAELLRARRLASLKLRPVAPLVAVTPAKPAKVVDLLRAAGYSPAADEGGGVVVGRPAARRGDTALLAGSRAWATLHRTAGHRTGEPGMDPQIWVRRLRLVDEPQARRRREALTRLAAAASEGRPVRLTYVAASGRQQQHRVVPLVVSEGEVRVQRVGADGPGEELRLEGVDVLAVE